MKDILKCKYSMWVHDSVDLKQLLQNILESLVRAALSHLLPHPLTPTFPSPHHAPVLTTMSQSSENLVF